jgi:threonine dehydrogenase-like Zn-dependent dehydrogenase
VQKELDIRGSRNAMPRDFEAVIRYLNSGKCPTEMLISAVTTPENALQSMMRWADQPGKVFRILVCFD